MINSTISRTYSLLDATVGVRVEDAVSAKRAVARDEHAAERRLVAVSLASRLVAADHVALALVVRVVLDAFAVGDTAAVLAVGSQSGREHGGEHDGSDSELHFGRRVPKVVALSVDVEE